MRFEKNLIVMFFTFMLLVGFAFAFEIPASERAKEMSHAPEHSKVIVANDSGWFLEHVYIIHYAKPEGAGKPDKPSKGAKCYGTFSRWGSDNLVYDITTYDTDELSASEMVNTLVTSTGTWDDATSAELFNSVYNVYTTPLPFGGNDEYNTLMFGDWSDPNVIAVTSTWYSRGKRGQIYDSDILFNKAYVWGDASVNPSVMDFESIATHELGHFLGLDDMYDPTCSEVTMFGYGSEGETQARTLEAPDVNGLQSLYGA